MTESIPAFAGWALGARSFPLLADLEIVGQECAALLPSTSFEITGELLQLLAKAASCNGATYWQVRADVLERGAVWSDCGGFAADPDCADPTRRGLTLRDATAGYVWRSGTPVWTASLASDMRLRRPRQATSGLHGGIWFAVKTADVILGVIELLGKRLPLASNDDLRDIERLGVLLGYTIREGHKNMVDGCTNA